MKTAMARARMATGRWTEMADCVTTGRVSGIVLMEEEGYWLLAPLGAGAGARGAGALSPEAPLSSGFFSETSILYLVRTPRSFSLWFLMTALPIAWMICG